MHPGQGVPFHSGHRGPSPERRDRAGAAQARESPPWSVTTMCFDLNARPPIPAIAGGATDARDLTLTSADGTRFMAYAARAVNPSGAGMVVLPDVRGLH